MPLDPAIATVVTLLLATVFAVGAVAKLRAPAAFAGVVANYRLLPDPLVRPFALTLQLHGMRIPAVALMGTSVSTKQLELLAHANARHITVLLDGDGPGREAAEKVAGAIANVAWARTVQLPDESNPISSTRSNSSASSGAGKGSCVWRRKLNYCRGLLNLPGR